MNLIKLGFVWTLAVTSVAAYGAGCSEVKNAYDCNHICSRYKECYDSSYDVDSCESKCKDSANNNDTFANKADGCQSCEDDMSCVGAGFNCASQCIGIVP